MNERDIQASVEWDGCCEVCDRKIKLGEPVVTIGFTVVFRMTKGMHTECEKRLVALLEAAAARAKEMAAART